MPSNVMTRTGIGRVAALVCAAVLTVVLFVDPFGLSPLVPWLAAAGPSDADLSRGERVDAIYAGLDTSAPLPAETLTGSWGSDLADAGLPAIPAQLPEEDEQVVALDLGTAPAAYVTGTTDPPVVGEVSLGGMDVSVEPAASGPTPEAVRLHVASEADTAAAGVTGVLLDISDASTDPATVDPTIDLTVSYESFAGLVGGDWASRLRMVWIPECTDDTAECQPVPLDTVNDPATQTVSAVVPVSPGEPEIAAAAFRTTTTPTRSFTGSGGAGGSVAVTAGTAGSTGDWGATSLSSAATWGAGGATGGFSWGLPLGVPTVAAGPSPDLSISYSSSGTDGKIPSTNNQAGQLGEGFDLTTGYIERSYIPCSQDNTGNANNLDLPSGDLCWGPENATFVFKGSGGELIKDATSGVWKSKNDDGSLIEYLTDGDNGSHSDDYWKVTTTDGAQYFFGRGVRSSTSSVATNSAWTVPVYGNNPGEPCYKSPSNGGFADSRCTQVWRWNLEYVIDPSDNTMTYFYKKETNKYVYDFVDNYAAATVSYVAGGRVDRIEYGTRKNAEGTAAAAKVTFDTKPRCITSISDPTSFCTSTQTSTDSNKWPDTPTDLICSDATQCSNYSPVFFDRYRLASVTTWTNDGTTFQPVDSWAIKHRFVAQGTGIGIDHADGVMLIVDSITHTGMNGTADTSDDLAMPANQFNYTFMTNRVNGDTDGLSPMWLPRLTNLRTETGAAVTVSYRTECATGDQPETTDTAQSGNTKLCFPVKWYPNGDDQSKVEYFHKYVVDTQAESGAPNKAGSLTTLITGSKLKVTSFSYVGGAAWAKPTGAMVKPKEVTYSDFRGFDEVRTTVGTGGESSTVSTRYFRGTGGSLTAGPAGNVITVTDATRFAGQVFVSTQLNGSKKISETVTVPGTPESIAENAKHVHAYRIPSSTTSGFTYDNDEQLVFRTRSSTMYDQYSLPTQTNDEGDLSRADDNVCTRNTYARVPGSATMNKRMVRLLTEMELVSKLCSQPIVGPADVLSDSLTTYDDSGRAIEFKRLDPVNGSGYVTTRKITSYDTRGRPLVVEDAMGHQSIYSYVDTAQGLLVSQTTTTPDRDGVGPLTAFSSKTTFNPLTGAVVKATDLNNLETTGTYDALGRLLTVRYPQHQNSVKPSVEYQYTVSDTGLNVVLTKTLGADGDTQHVSATFYDGLLRAFQTQTEALDSGTNHEATSAERGRMVTYTKYDSAGRIQNQAGAWWVQGAPSAIPEQRIAVAPSETTLEYDSAGRVTDTVFWDGTVSASLNEKWRSKTFYNGSTTLQIPPMGATPQATVTDVQGHVTDLIEYIRDPDTNLGAAAIDEVTVLALPNQTTKYEYDAAGNRTKMTDPANAVWTYSYDHAGRQIASTDPDAGTTSTEYNSLDQVLTRTDSNNATVTYTYDALGRNTKLSQGSIVLAEWVFDAAKFAGTSTTVLGQLSSSTRTVDGHKYVSSVPTYDRALRPTATTLTLPSDLPEFAALKSRTYTTKYSYTSDGQLASMELPAIVGSDDVKSLGREIVTTRYDSSSLPSLMSGGFGWGTYVAESRYSAEGLPLITDLGNTYGAIVSYGYDASTKQLTGISLDRERFDGTDLALAYKYDDAGNVTSAKDRPSATAVAATSAHDNQCYGYDGLQRLQVAWTPANENCGTKQEEISAGIIGGVSPYWTEYSYDKVGNRTGMTDHGIGTTPTAITTYSMAPGSHRLASTSTTSGTTTSSNSYTYDNAGNRASKTAAGATVSYNWDAEGKMTSVDGAPEEDGQFVYDTSGNRIVRTDASGTTVYLPGGQEILINDETVSATRYYSFAGKTVAVRTGKGLGGVTSLVCDAHGSVAASVPNTVWQANSVKRVFSDPFGGVRNGSDAGVPGDHRFLGAVRDTGTGLTLLGARYYDESVGRFVSVDPLLEAGLPAQFNAYVYSGNNPATFSDPLGTTWKSDKPENLPGSKPTSGSSSGTTTQPGTTAPAPTSWAARDACAGNMWCLWSWGFGGSVQALGGFGEGLVDFVLFTTGIPMLIESVQEGYQAVTDWDGYSAKKQAERDAMWGVVTGGPEAWGKAFIDPIVDEWENNPGHLVGGATFTTATFIVPGAGEIKALRGVKGLEQALSVPSRVESAIGKSINAGKQERHLLGTVANEDGRGGYFKSIDDAQAVLDSYHAGTAEVLGATKSGSVVVRVPSVTGFNNNVGAGFLGQPTNVFLIKGTKNVSVVPTTPNWSP
jgi:RHS repeat-associated protein